MRAQSRSHPRSRSEGRRRARCCLCSVRHLRGWLGAMRELGLPTVALGAPAAVASDAQRAQPCRRRQILRWARKDSSWYAVGDPRELPCASHLLASLARDATFEREPQVSPAQLLIVVALHGGEWALEVGAAGAKLVVRHRPSIVVSGSAAAFGWSLVVELVGKPRVALLRSAFTWPLARGVEHHNRFLAYRAPLESWLALASLEPGVLPCPSPGALFGFKTCARFQAHPNSLRRAEHLACLEHAVHQSWRHRPSRWLALGCPPPPGSRALLFTIAFALTFARARRVSHRRTSSSIAPSWPTLVSWARRYWSGR